MTCEQRRDLLLLYVSDALEADETREVRHHLATGCPECAGYLAEAEATFHSIPQDLDVVLPPPGLKQRLMDRIDAAELKSGAAANRSADVRTELPPDSFPIRLFRLLVPAAVAAGVAVVVTHAIMNQKMNKLALEAYASQREATASKMIIMEQAQSIDMLRQKFQSQTQVVEMLRSPDVKVVHLKSQPAQPDATANVVWDAKGNRWEFLATGMKPAAAGQTYELWIIPKGGAPLPAGTFDVDASGSCSVAVDLPKDLGVGNTAAVTNEKAGGDVSPKGTAQVAGVVE